MWKVRLPMIDHLHHSFTDSSSLIMHLIAGSSSSPQSLYLLALQFACILLLAHLI